VFRKLMGMFSSPRAAAEKPQGDVHALDRSGDPRGGVQSDEYRHAEPVEIVEGSAPGSGGVAMSGPGGAPPDDSTPDERLDAERS
jgi:hypothetical protein